MRISLQTHNVLLWMSSNSYPLYMYVNSNSMFNDNSITLYFYAAKVKELWTEGGASRYFTR